MHRSPNQEPPQPRYTVRMDAHLDAMTRPKLEELAAAFRRSLAAVLREVMRWGLSRQQTAACDQSEVQGPIQHVFLQVDAVLHGQVRQAARAAGVPVAPWLRHVLRQITPADFPASWQSGTQDMPAIDPAGQVARRSHDSRGYDTRFMLRLGRRASRQLQALTEHFGTSKAAIIRQLVAQATPEDFPQSWQLAAKERERRREHR